MEIENLDNDNVPGIWVSVYEITGIAIKATLVFETPQLHTLVALLRQELN